MHPECFYSAFREGGNSSSSSSSEIRIFASLLTAAARQSLDVEALNHGCEHGMGMVMLGLRVAQLQLITPPSSSFVFKRARLPLHLLSLPTSSLLHTLFLLNLNSNKPPQ